jgi:hypothetical protein
VLLKDFEKKEKDLKARAATNLSFLYFLEGDIPNAEKHAEVAVRTNRYNAQALVNQGNCLFNRVCIHSNSCPHAVTFRLPDLLWILNFCLSTL